jgi:hypothetical protein
MPISRIHSYLVYPSKNEESQPTPSGTEVEDSKLHRMLTTLYDSADRECDIPIIFRHDEDGRQQNPCRELIVAYVQKPTIDRGRRLAERLQSVSTHRSGLGLLFLIVGHDGSDHRLVLSRFPADSGVIAEENAGRLSVDFIEKVFMKNVKAYKSALYAHGSLDAGFWKGFAVDRQISGPHEMSEYWIGDFLQSDLRTTAAAGTKRLATAIVGAIRSTDSPTLKSELIAAVQLLRNQTGRRSARRFLERLGISDRAFAAIERGYSRGALLDEPFQIDADELGRHAAYRAVELDNGGMLLAEEPRFEDVFKRESLNAERVRFSTEGRIVDESLRKTK